MKLAPDEFEETVDGKTIPSPNGPNGAGDALPGSSAGIHCHHDGCVESLTLARTTTVQPAHDDDYQMLMPARDAAAALLGWRVCQSVFWCPTHVVVKKLACARCISPCPECSCMGGPRLEAVEGMIE